MAVPKQEGIVDRVKRSIGFHKSHASKDLKLDLEYIKCVFIGGRGLVGKSTLLRSFTRGEYIDIGFVPTAGLDLFEATVMVDGKRVQFQLLDTSGAYDYDGSRPRYYPLADVFLICYDVVDHESFKSVHEEWYPEVRQHCPNVPIVLVACKVDLRHDTAEIARLSSKKLAPLTYKQGLELQKKIGAVDYAECSALTFEGVNALFEEVIPAAVISAAKKQKGKKKKDFLKK